MVNRREDQLSDISKVGVLLFDRSGGGGTRQQAEVMTEVFSLQIRRYFPILLERFEIEEELTNRGETIPSTLTPTRARELGEIFDCDAFFTGRITFLRERSSLFGLRGAHQFSLAVNLVSARTGDILLSSTVNSEASFLLPLETSREISIHSVRKMVEKFGFEEGGAGWLTRESPLWIAALQAYEERRFWDAARDFGEAISQYPVSVLTEESYLYLGRCFYELSLPRGAERAWTSLAELFPESHFVPIALGEKAALYYREGRAASGDSLSAYIRRVYGECPPLHQARYAAGVVAKNGRDYPRALRQLATVPPQSDYGPHARFLRAECFAAAGRDDAALGELEAATEGAYRSAGRTALAADAWIALGRQRLRTPEVGAALGFFDRVDPADDRRGEAAVGRAWCHLRLGDAEAAADALADDSRWSGYSALEARFLRAVAAKELGDPAAAEEALDEVTRGLARLRSVAPAASTQREIDLIRASLHELDGDAWSVVMRRPSEQRVAEGGRIGSRLATLQADLDRARDEIARATELELDAPRMAALEEKTELLRATLSLGKRSPRIAKAVADSAAADSIGAAGEAWARARKSDLLVRRDGSELRGRVVSLTVSDVGFHAAGAPIVRLVPRVELNRVVYAQGEELAGGRLYSEHDDLRFRPAYVREVSQKPYLMETELQIPRREVAERSILRGFIVSSVATMLAKGSTKLLVFPAVFAGQFALAYLTGI